MCITNKKSAAVKRLILLSGTETLLLIVYSVCFPITLFKMVNILDYHVSDQVLLYFDHDRIQAFKTFHDVLNYTQDLMVNKLRTADGLPQSSFKPIGSVRLAQTRIKAPDYCYSSAFNQSCQLLLSTQTFAQTFYPNVTLNKCVDDCQELNLTNAFEYDLKGYFTLYPQRAFKVDFDGNNTKTKEKIDNLQTWVDDFTRALILKWNVYDIWTKQLFRLTLIAESLGSHRMRLVQCNVNLDIVQFYKNLDPNESVEQASTDNLFVIVMSIFIASIIIYFAKIAFELNMNLGLITNSLELLHLMCLIVAITLQLTSMAIKNQAKIDLSDDKKFLDVQSIINIESYARTLISACAIFYPFRIFMLLSRLQASKNFQEQINAIYRMLPGTVVFICTVAAVSVGWSLCVYIMFQDRVQEMSTFQGSLIMVTSGNLLNNLDFKQSYFNMNNSQSFFVVLISQAQVLVFALFTALVTYLYSKTAKFQDSTAIKTPDKIQNLKLLQEIQEQVSQIHAFNAKIDDLKIPNKILELQYRNTKIVGWLLNRPRQQQQQERDDFINRLNQALNDQSQAEEKKYLQQNREINSQLASVKKRKEFRSEQSDMISQPISMKSKKISVSHANQGQASQTIQVQCIEFEWLNEMKLFLSSLFQLKPQFKTSFALDKFRIVVEYSQFIRVDKQEQAYRSLEQLLDYLNEIGCKVPVLFYTDLNLAQHQQNDLNRLKKKYYMLFSTTKMVELQNFCKMDSILK